MVDINQVNAPSSQWAWSLPGLEVMASKLLNMP
jgi:hypothetical protein